MEGPAQPYGHKYPIGSNLVHRGFLGTTSVIAPPRLFVVSQLVQRQDMGVVLSYQCRITGDLATTKLHVFDECELATWEEYAAELDAELARRSAVYRQRLDKWSKAKDGEAA